MQKRMKRASTISTGDIFQFRIPGGNCGYGQVIRSDILHYIVIFRPILPCAAEMQSIPSAEIILAGWTMDARFYSGDWQVLGNRQIDDHIELPNYKVEMSGKIWITDVDGKIIRPANTEEISSLRYKSSNSPIAFEKAFQAYHQQIPWEARFDELRAGSR